MGYGQLISAAVGQVRNMYGENRTRQKLERAQKNRNQGWWDARVTYTKYLNMALDDLKPYVDAGKVNLEEIMTLFDDPSSVRDTPGYDFRLQEGEKGGERSASARGGLYSGRQMKEMNRYAQDYASNEYTQAIDRRLSLGDYLSQYDKMNNETLMEGGQNLGNIDVGAGNARARGIENLVESGRYWVGTMNNQSDKIGSGIDSSFGGGGGSGGSFGGGG